MAGVKPARPGDAGYRRPNMQHEPAKPAKRAPAKQAEPAPTDQDLIIEPPKPAETNPVRLPSAPVAVDDGAAFVLGVLVWGWLILPFLRGGMPEVRNVLRAKFFNKAADGSWLP